MSDCFHPAADLALQPFRRRGLPRSLEIICAGTGIILLAPLAAAVALAIKASDGGPVFYRQERVGKGFRPFLLLKFRTMVIDADRDGLLTGPADTRVTRPGRVLRKYKLDEIPQLVNVLLGDMQFVGPRPEVARYVELFRAEYEQLLREPPGVTDPASIAFRDEENCFSADNVESEYLSRILPRKLALSLEYQRRRTFFSDLRILLSTIVKLPQ